MSLPHVIIAGGSGFLGQALAQALVAQQHRVTILTRTPRPSTGPIAYLPWDGRTPAGWTAALEGARAVVNLTGRSVNCRYTPANRREILESRVHSVQAINQAVARCAQPPQVLIQACSLAIYGDTGDRICDESAPAAHGFSTDICRAWEGAFEALPTPQSRRVILRIGFVLGRNGGALGTLAALAKWGLGGTVGSGRQYISWIHLADMNRLVLWAIERNDVSGVFNATGPNPVPNALFMRELRGVLHRPWSPPAPAPLVRLGSWLMGTEAELALTGRRCISQRLAEHHFPFAFPELRPALHDLLASPQPGNLAGPP